MKLKKFLVVFLIIWGGSVSADLNKAWQLLRKSNGSTRTYPLIVREMVESGLYFASIPYIKEYLATTKVKNIKSVDALIDKVITEVGVKQFSVLPISILSRTTAPIVKYILAKKYFRKRKYKKALKALNGTIGRLHPIKPFALLLEASILSINKNYKSAVAAYQECQNSADDRISRTKQENLKRQLEITRDYCLVGIARANFARGNYTEASSAYLDLPKSSHIWPEILFEEAWSSFYQRDYNRSLGKLVTYKAPVLSYIFNPEVEVLKALTYMELCLWDDTKKTVDKFYKNYSSEHLQLEKFLKKHRKDYKYFYLLAKSRLNGKVRGNKLLNRILGAIVKDPAFRELYRSFQNGRAEIEKLASVGSKSYKKILRINLKDTLVLQRDLLGAYVRKHLHTYSYQINKTFQGLSYIKLEVLSRRKERLYSSDRIKSRNRGDIVNLKRTDKQYFWAYNGEFWADELGDYVFSLKSRCSE